MGDSDPDDYDQRQRGGRDKFRRERDDSDRRGRGDDRRGQPRQPTGKRDYSGGRDMGGARRDRDISPNGLGSKRGRRDFREQDQGAGGQDNSQQGGGMPGGPMMPMMPMMPMGPMGPMAMNPMAAAAMMAAAAGRGVVGPAGATPGQGDEGIMTQPPMMTFKQFVLRLDDMVNEFDAAKGFSQYKTDFQRQVLSDFFEAHKDEEWFRVRYAPGVCEERRREQRRAVLRRRDVFVRLYKHGLLGGFTLDMSHQTQIERALDAAVVLLEGGSDAELEAFLLSSSSNKPSDDGDAEVPGVRGDDELMPPGMAGDDVKKSGNGTGANSNLHKNVAIFLRNVPVDIPRVELEKFLGQYAGFQRLALSEPLFERKVIRRGWATFSASVPIQEICENIRQATLMGHSLQPIINRELKQRVRPISGNMAHRRAARADLRNAARIALRLDTKWGVWRTDEGEESAANEEREQMEAADSILGSWTAIAWNGCSNPVLRDAGDLLLEFGDNDDQDEEDDMAISGGAGSDPTMELAMQRDELLLNKLDSILLYLRVVHSLDYYSGTEYPQEDEMPQRCGIIHARGSPSVRLTLQDLLEWRTHIARKLAPWLSQPFVLPPDDLQRLGAKESDPAELQKILSKSFVEIKADKWRCLVCEKMFKGEEFVKKHLLSKHGMEDKATAQTRYFNNYVLDPRRPHLSEHPANRALSMAQQSGGASGITTGTGGSGILPTPVNTGAPFPAFFMPGPFGPPFMPFGGPGQSGNGQPQPNSPTSGNGTMGGKGRSGGRPIGHDVRSGPMADGRGRSNIASYEDLDAPKDELPF